MTFIPRLIEPSTTNQYYIVTSSGGLNECVEIENGSALPNCVGYAWGRIYEINKTRPNLSTGNAGDWYNYNDGYSRVENPKLGAVMCFSKENAHGHVAVVEQINDDGSITLSNSGYNYKRFYLTTMSKPYTLSGYQFQGFIYATNDSPTPTIKSKKKSSWILYRRKKDDNLYKVR